MGWFSHPAVAEQRYCPAKRLTDPAGTSAGGYVAGSEFRSSSNVKQKRLHPPPNFNIIDQNSLSLNGRSTSRFAEIYFNRGDTFPFTK
jgi:hypothetical protein